MRWLKQWRSMLTRGAVEAVLATCQFGSPHQKEFRFLLAGIRGELVEMRCRGGHKHIRIEGKYTKQSAIYPPAMAEHLSLAFVDALARMRLREEGDRLRGGLQGLLVDDVLRTEGWKESCVWYWKARSHINVLEVSSALTAMKLQIKKQRRVRMKIELDSMVAKGALAKGRSSARTLGPVMKRVAAVALAGDLYVAYNYAATKLNVSDDPTRERPIREGSKLSVRQFLDMEELRDESMFSLSPGLSCWFRMTVLLVGIQGGEANAWVGLSEEVSQSFFEDPSWNAACSFSSFLRHFAALDFPYLPFLRHLGLSLSLFTPSLHWYPELSSEEVPRSSFSPLVVLILPVRAPMAPDTRAEADRANLRVHLKLNADRVVRHETRDRRYRLLDDFRNWLWEEHSIAWESLLNSRPLTQKPFQVGWSSMAGIFMRLGRAITSTLKLSTLWQW